MNATAIHIHSLVPTSRKNGNAQAMPASAPNIYTGRRPRRSDSAANPTMVNSSMIKASISALSAARHSDGGDDIIETEHRKQVAESVFRQPRPKHHKEIPWLPFQRFHGRIAFDLAARNHRLGEYRSFGDPQANKNADQN